MPNDSNPNDTLNIPAAPPPAPSNSGSGSLSSKDPNAEAAYQQHIEAARKRLEEVEAALGAHQPVPAATPPPATSAAPTAAPVAAPKLATTPTGFSLGALKNPVQPVAPTPPSPLPVPQPQPQPTPAAVAAPVAPTPAPATPPPAPQPDIAAMIAQHKSVSPLGDTKAAAAPAVNPLSNAAQQPQAPTEDLKPIKEKHRGPIAPSRLKPLITAVIVFFVVMGIFKAPIFYYQLKYLFTSQSATNTPAPSTATTAQAASVPTLYIPKINVTTPVIFEPSIEEAAVQKALESGVVHYGNTANPGEVGNTVIFGHSSNDWDKPGNYKFIFVLLEKLAVGDTFSIDYKGTRYDYQIAERRIILATDVGVVAPTPDPEATLITCWPTGTSQKRLFVRAKQTSPAPSASATAAANQTVPKTTVLPDSQSNTGLTGSVNDWINNFWSALRGDPVQIN